MTDNKEAVEAVHRAMTDAMGGWVGPNIARIALQAARPFLLEEAARIAERGALVPPDGGAPTPEENAVADNIAAAIRAAKETGGAKGIVKADTLPTPPDQER